MAIKNIKKAINNGSYNGQKINSHENYMILMGININQ